MYKIFNANCTDVIGSQTYKDITKDKEVIIVTDPPFNIGYHYHTYDDNLPEEQYYEWLGDILEYNKFVIIHYPEAIYKLSFQIGRFPNKIISWVYNSNTAKQHRDIAFFDIHPDFELVRQPYKNINDKRIRARIANGSKGGRLYDWWNINQVKNTTKGKTKHPCQMPQKVMDNIIGILPNKKDIIVVDPFMESGTTGEACINAGVDFVGVEIDDAYYSIACKRLQESTAQLSMRI